MNKQQFLKQLENKLACLPQCEIDSAIEYYQEYLNEIPDDQHADAIAKLGGTQQVADRLIAEYDGDNSDTTGLQPSTEPTSSTAVKHKLSTSNIVLLILASPLIITVLGGVFCGVVGLWGGALAIVLSAYIVALSLGITGIAMIGASIVSLPAVANLFVLLGASLAMVGLSILFVFAGNYLAKLLCKITKYMCKYTVQGTKWLYRQLFVGGNGND